MIFGSKKNSASADGNGSLQAAPQIPPQQPEKAPDKLSDVEQRQRRVAASLRLSAAFTQIVTLLMRSPAHKHLSISDLEWLVLPPLVTGQFRMAKVGSKKTGVAVPAAVVLWARVSPEVDAKLSANATAPIRLRPDEWRSGEIVWLVEAVGDARIVGRLLKELNENTLKGRDVKVRTREAGKPAIGTLQGLVSKSPPN